MLAFLALPLVIIGARLDHRRTTRQKGTDVAQGNSVDRGNRAGDDRRRESSGVRPARADAELTPAAAAVEPANVPASSPAVEPLIVARKPEPEPEPKPAEKSKGRGTRGANGQFQRKS